MNEEARAWTLCGSRLEDLVRQAQEQVVLVAPFIKVPPFRRLVSSVTDDVIVTVVTRWRPDDVALGVTDLEVWDEVKTRPGTELRLCSSLHAKYYRADESCLVGSANITGKALDWGFNPNTELLVSLPAAAPSLAGFEQELLAMSSPANDSIADVVRAAAALLHVDRSHLPTEDSPPEEQPAPRPIDCWVPRLRHPEELLDFYQGRFGEMTRSSRAAAAEDLSDLGVPEGLAVEQVRAFVGAQMLQCAVVASVDAYLDEPRRFGAVAKVLHDELEERGQPANDCNAAWQTLMRWLLYFLPERYSLSVPHYSEVMVRNK